MKRRLRAELSGSGGMRIRWRGARAPAGGGMSFVTTVTSGLRRRRPDIYRQCDSERVPPPRSRAARRVFVLACERVAQLNLSSAGALFLSPECESGKGECTRQ